MDLLEMKRKFEKECIVYERKKLIFTGVEGFDVYNASIPFNYGGKEYIFARIERREEWARSWVRLFEKSGEDRWSAVPDSMIYPLEDPYISVINGEFVLGGTHVRMKKGKLETFYCYFYRGAQLDDLVYFTTGPDRMKDIRLIDLNGKIGVFSRPRGEAVRNEYGSESIIGYTEISSIEELSPQIIENAAPISGLFGKDQWGGCNQAYLLEDGMIGVIGHISFHHMDLSVYMNMSYVLDRKTNRASELKIIGTRSCYPAGPCKRPKLADCVFTSGIVMREDGKVDLYSGLGDVEVGRIVIDYPFEGHGGIV